MISVRNFAAFIHAGVINANVRDVIPLSGCANGRTPRAISQGEYLPPTTGGSLPPLGKKICVLLSRAIFPYKSAQSGISPHFFARPLFFSRRIRRWKRLISACNAMVMHNSLLGLWSCHLGAISRHVRWQRSVPLKPPTRVAPERTPATCAPRRELCFSGQNLYENVIAAFCLAATHNANSSKTTLGKKADRLTTYFARPFIS